MKNLLVVALAIIAAGLLGSVACAERSLTVDTLKVEDSGWIFDQGLFVNATRNLFLPKDTPVASASKYFGDSRSMRIERHANGFHLYKEGTKSDFHWGRVKPPLSESDFLPVTSLRIDNNLVYSAGDPAIGEVPLSFAYEFPVAEMRVGEAACLFSYSVGADPEGHTYIRTGAWAHGQTLIFGQKDGGVCDSRYYGFRIERTDAGFQATILAAFTGLRTHEGVSTNDGYYPVVSLSFPERANAYDPILKQYLGGIWQYPARVGLSARGKGARMPAAYLANFPVLQLELGEGGFLRRGDIVLDQDRRMYISAEAEIYGTSVCQRPSSDGLNCSKKPQGLDTKDAPLVISRLEDGYSVYALHEGENEDQSYIAYSPYRWGMIPVPLAGVDEFVPVKSFYFVRNKTIHLLPHRDGKAVQVPWRFVGP